VLARVILHVRDAPIIYSSQHVITYSLKQGIAKLNESVNQAASKDMRQHHRECFMPIYPKTKSATERKHIPITYHSGRKEGWIAPRQTLCQWQSATSMDGPRPSC